MNTKLTLNIDKDLITMAKSYAKNRNRSLSDLVESLLQILISSEENKDQVLTTRVKSLSGAFNLPDDFDYKKALGDSLNEKYQAND